VNNAKCKRPELWLLQLQSVVVQLNSVHEAEKPALRGRARQYVNLAKHLVRLPIYGYAYFACRTLGHLSAVVGHDLSVKTSINLFFRVGLHERDELRKEASHG